MISCLFWISYGFPSSAQQSDISTGRSLFREGSTQPKSQSCGSCHGFDAGGQVEGEFHAPAIFRGRGGIEEPSYASANRARIGYSLADFSRTLRIGVDASGNHLSPRMPLFRYSDAEVQQLWSYLEHVTHEQSQGVSDSAIVLAVAGPTELVEKLTFIAGTLQKSFAGRDMISGRRVEFITEAVSRQMLSDQFYCPGTKALALVNMLPDQTGIILNRATACGVPVIAPFRQLHGTENENAIRGISASLADQWAALLVHHKEPFEILPANNMQAEEHNMLQAVFGNNPQVTTRSDTLLAPFGLNRATLKSAKRILAPADNSLASLQNWLDSGVEVILADPVSTPTKSTSQTPPVERHINTTANLIFQALMTLNNGITRHRLMRAIDQQQLDETDWPKLDYTNNRLTGTRTTEVKIFSPSTPK